MTVSIQSWWAFLSALAVCNIAAWAIMAREVARNSDVHRLQLVLSGVYVFGCAFRSFLPVFDIPRMCLVDTWLASVLVGRSVATVAELAFAAQWALLLREGARFSGNEPVRTVSRLIVPMIVIAEICSWTAVLTTANLGHVFENSLWGIAAALIVASLIALAPRWPARGRTALGLWIITGLIYVAFMFLEDVPMYWARWVADEAAAKAYLTLAQGLADASACKVVSFRWEDWRNEVAWMTLYFSGGVWASLSLVRGTRTTAR